MSTFVALLRGVNVGKAKRVPMAELRALLGELGYARAATLPNSGNAVFQAQDGTPAKHAAAIADALAVRLEFQVPVIVKSVKELSAIVAENALAAGAQNHSHLLATFTQDPETLAGLAVIEPWVSPPERFLIVRNAAYLHCAGSMLGKAGKSATTRNWATVLKLQALACGSDHGLDA